MNLGHHVLALLATIIDIVWWPCLHQDTCTCRYFVHHSYFKQMASYRKLRNQIHLSLFMSANLLSHKSCSNQSSTFVCHRAWLSVFKLFSPLEMYLSALLRCPWKHSSSHVASLQPDTDYELSLRLINFSDWNLQQFEMKCGPLGKDGREERWGSNLNAMTEALCLTISPWYLNAGSGMEHWETG